VHRGRCLPCYMRARPTLSALHPTCASAIHGDVSTDKKPTVHQSIEIFPFRWLGPKAAEQAGRSRLCREQVCPACRTVAEKRNRTAALSATRAELAAADFTPDADARAQPTSPAARSLVGPVTGTVWHSSGGVGAVHAPAQAAGTAADGEPVTAADCAPAPAVQCAPAVVADGAPVSAADCAPALALDRARVAIGVSRPAQPSVDSAIATVAAAYGTMSANNGSRLGPSSAPTWWLKIPAHCGPGPETGGIYCTPVKQCRSRRWSAAGMLAAGLSRRQQPKTEFAGMTRLLWRLFSRASAAEHGNLGSCSCSIGGRRSASGALANPVPRGYQY